MIWNVYQRSTTFHLEIIYIDVKQHLDVNITGSFNICLVALLFKCQGLSVVLNTLAVIYLVLPLGLSVLPLSKFTFFDYLSVFLQETRILSPIMTQFTDLPNEILTLIAQHVHPRDIVNFSSISKLIHSLCETSLKVHHKMRQKYSRRQCTGRGSQLAYLLSDIILQPTVALYVECLDVRNFFGGWERIIKHRTGPWHSGYPQKMMVRLTQAIADTVPTDQVPRWTAALESGDEDPVLALLLLRLPAITTLDLEIDITLQCLFQTMALTLRAPGVPFLPALTTLYLDWKGNYSEDPEWQALQAISYFAMLPSLRSMVIQNLSLDQGIGDIAYLLQPQSSNVTSIKIINGNIPEQPQYQFLQGFKALRKFSYKNSYILQDPVWTHPALLAHCKASLEHLGLSISSENRYKGSYMGSLRDFENLKEVHTYRSHLLHDWSSDSQVIAKVLPASIEKVHLREDLCATPKDIQNIILNAAKDKHQKLPSLQELHVSLYTKARDLDLDLEDMAATVHMQTKCKEAGFKLIID